MLNNLQLQLSVEPFNGIVVARISGVPTPELFALCEERVAKLCEERGTSLVMYDAVDVEPPGQGADWFQRPIDLERTIRAKRVIVGPNLLVAQLIRSVLAIEPCGSHVVYNDFATALAWLKTP